MAEVLGQYHSDVEFQFDGQLYSLRMFPTAEIATPAYDIVAWRFMRS
jgi:hypothetical protein